MPANLTATRFSVIVCRLCGNRCHGPIDTGNWTGHKTTCPAHPSQAQQPSSDNNSNPTRHEEMGHPFDPCPISGRCGVCGVRPEVHPVVIKRRATR